MKKKIIILGIIVILLTVSLSGCNDIASVSTNDVYEKSKEFMLDRLKAPASAQFPSVDKATVIQKNQNLWVVLSYVDAQNSYGALIRTYYCCEIIEGATEWTLLSLNTGENIDEVKYKWTIVQTFIGGEDRETSAFKINGEKWRIDWETGGKENTGGLNLHTSLSITIYDASDDGLVTFISEGDTYASDSDEIFDLGEMDFASAGYYYLNIRESFLTSWTVRVYEATNLIEE